MKIFNPNFGLFKYGSNSINLHPSQISNIIENHLDVMSLAGMIIAQVRNLFIYL